ncbi:MAG: ribulose-phosphate 3-epimerase [Ezakiella sp.]|nr:ribulose-phosphate 3-epimerase [Ezakiella sp.]MDD7762006.1 ribulose-phosphate 3-epimerase [Bacillota bacterium]MDY3946547.1 ribulose-phosphate 3-epimerase [Ezakiella sp.]
MVRIAPSVLSCDFLNLEDDINMMKNAGIDILHMDIMDGLFVPNISYGPMILEAIRRKFDIDMDVHLMIKDPNRYFEIYSKIGVSYLTIHEEASLHLERDISRIKELGMKAGVALNPATSPENLKYIIKELDLVLVMSVNPGFGGQKFLESQLDKVRDIRDMIDKTNSNAIIEIDGGITADNVKLVAGAGVDMVVSGSGLLKGNFEENLSKMRNML